LEVNKAKVLWKDASPELSYQMLKVWHHIGEDRPNMEVTTHRRWAEVAAEKWSLFRPHRGLTAPDLFLVAMLSRRIWKACPINYTEALNNIYRNESQTCHPKGKTYRDAQLGKLAHSVGVDHVLEHGVVYRSEPAREKCGEDETATGRQPPRASGYEGATPSWGQQLGVAEALFQENIKPPT
jgi:hypothetical protein